VVPQLGQFLAENVHMAHLRSRIAARRRRCGGSFIVWEMTQRNWVSRFFMCLCLCFGDDHCYNVAVIMGRFRGRLLVDFNRCLECNVFFKLKYLFLKIFLLIH